MLSTRHFSLTAILLAQALAASGARGETRSLSLYFGHTKESITVVYKRDGRFDPNGLTKLNQFLRDWRQNESTRMDPRLFDILWTVHKEAGSKVPIQIVSAYRSPKTNAKLRSRSRGVAKNSQHKLGRAIDFYMPDVSLAKIRAIGLRLQAGGVGFYPRSGSPFVHLDTGSVRHWPRMTREQLVRVFPKGNTLHIPSDGKPLAGYQLAKAEYEKRRRQGVAMASLSPSRPRNPFSFLFGDDNDDDQQRQAAAAVQVAAQTQARETVPAEEESPVRIAKAVPRPQRRPDAIETALVFASEPPRPRPASEPLARDALASLIAREKEQWTARVSALASMAEPAKPRSIAAAAPAVLAKLGPIRGDRGMSASDFQMFDRSDLGLLFDSNRVSRDDALKSESGGELYTIPTRAPAARFSRFGNFPTRGDRLVVRWPMERAALEALINQN